MTEQQQHPLTDEMCESICQKCDIFASQNEIWFQSMRAAADWQLEQVIEWLEETEYDQYHHNKIIYVNDIRKAMRPQQQEGN